MSLRNHQVAFNPSHMVPGIEPSADPGKNIDFAAVVIVGSYSLFASFAFLSTQSFRLVCSYAVQWRLCLTPIVPITTVAFVLLP